MSALRKLRKARMEAELAAKAKEAELQQVDEEDTSPQAASNPFALDGVPPMRPRAPQPPVDCNEGAPPITAKKKKKKKNTRTTMPEPPLPTLGCEGRQRRHRRPEPCHEGEGKREADAGGARRTTLSS
mmetsp:Transcript_18757/g.35948  ORF Transcript_18757/g.35948 Transcript_18757/m.35948 type:complete len:128 (+) Transcript_18757:80-463(+)